MSQLYQFCFISWFGLKRQLKRKVFIDLGQTLWMTRTSLFIHFCESPQGMLVVVETKES